MNETSNRKKEKINLVFSLIGAIQFQLNSIQTSAVWLNEIELKERGAKSNIKLKN